MPNVARTPCIKNDPATKNTSLSLTGCLQDIPTYISTTAATLNTDDINDDDFHQSHPSLSTKTSAFTPAFLQQWDEVYNDFLHLAHAIGVLTLSTNEELIASLPAVPNAVDSNFPANNNDPETITAFLSKLDNLHNRLIQLINLFSTLTSCTPATMAAPVNNDHVSNHHNNDKHDNSKCNNNCNNNDHANGDRSTALCQGMV